MPDEPPDAPVPEPRPLRSDAPATYVPKPPTPAETAALSEAQALITDEWTGEPPAPKPPG